MRTAIWETSPGALAALLNSGVPLNKADLYTLTLADGTVLRWSGADVAIVGAVNTWALGPGLRRTKVRFTVGIQVDSLQVTVTDILGTTINGKGLMAFIAAGGLNGARLQLDRCFWGPDDTAPVGAVLWFTGRIGEIPSVDRYAADLSFASDTQLFDTMVPRDVYQAGCLNTVYDATCGVSRSAFTVVGAATSASTADRTAFNHGLAQASGHFSLGVITMTSGPNAGISRTVKRHTGSLISVMPPWPFAVANGNTFSVRPGCDGRQSTCTTKFSNLPRFRGQPYVPEPETVT